MVSDELRETALVMMGELEQERLVVSMAPSVFPEVAAAGGKIRVVDSRNPAWYQEFCWEYRARRTKPRRRQKIDTAIKRRDTLRGLAEIATGRVESEYAQRLLPFVEAEWQRYKKEYGHERVTDFDGRPLHGGHF